MHGGKASGFMVCGYSSCRMAPLRAVNVFLSLSTVAWISGGSWVTFVSSFASMWRRISSWRRRVASCWVRVTWLLFSCRFMSFHCVSCRVVVFWRYVVKGRVYVPVCVRVSFHSKKWAISRIFSGFSWLRCS